TEVGRGLARELLEGNAAEFGDLFGGVADEAGFVRLAAMGDRREVGRVGLYDIAISRDDLGNLLNFLGILEGYDAGKGDVAAQCKGAFGEVAAGSEAMEHEGKGPCPALFFEDIGHVFVGGAAVDNQWKTGD